MKLLPIIVVVGASCAQCAQDQGTSQVSYGPQSPNISHVAGNVTMCFDGSDCKILSEKPPALVDDRPQIALFPPQIGNGRFYAIFRNSGSLPALRVFLRNIALGGEGTVLYTSSANDADAHPIPKILPGAASNFDVNAPAGTKSEVLCFHYSDKEEMETHMEYSECFLFDYPSGAPLDAAAAQLPLKWAFEFLSGFNVARQRIARPDEESNVAKRDTPERRSALRERTMRFVVSLEEWYPRENDLWNSPISKGMLPEKNAERKGRVIKEIQRKWKQDFSDEAKYLLFEFKSIRLNATTQRSFLS